MEKVEWVSVVDDAVAVRESVKYWLGSDPRFQIRSEHGSAEDALSALPEERPDILILDVRMGAMCGLECLHRIRSLLSATRIIMYTGYGSRDVLHHALDGGANGLVQKGDSLEALSQAIRPARLDGFYLTREGMSSLSGRTLDGRHINLTPRERSLLARLTDGQGNKQIAAELGLHPDYVARRFSELYVKLGVHNRAGASGLAREWGITTLRENDKEGHKNDRSQAS